MRFAIADDGDDSSKSEETHGPAPAAPKAEPKAGKLAPPRPETMTLPGTEPESDKEARAMALEEARGLCDKLQTGEGEWTTRLTLMESTRFSSLVVELLPKNEHAMTLAGSLLRGTIDSEGLQELVDAIGKVRK
jgi:hypothetical protein